MNHMGKSAPSSIVPASLRPLERGEPALETIRGMGVIGATAIAATVPDPKVFGSGSDFSAWIRLVPREDSTGGKQKLGPISKRGDRYLRRILVVGACAVLRYARHKPENGHRVGDAPVGAAFFQRANEVVASKQANRATHSVHHRELPLAGVQRGLDRRVDMCSSGVSDANLVDIATVTGATRLFGRRHRLC